MKYLTLLITLLFALSVFAKEETKFSVKVQEECIDAPVSISLSHLNLQLDSDSILLYELTNGKEREIAFQLVPSSSPELWFILDGVSKKNSVRRFSIKPAATPKEGKSSDYNLSKTSDDLIISYQDQTILKYRHSTMLPPDGIECRAKFIGRPPESRTQGLLLGCCVWTNERGNYPERVGV